MPRDLNDIKADGAPLQPQLTQSPEQFDEMDHRPPIEQLNGLVGEDTRPSGFFSDMAKKAEKAHEVHPYTQTLTTADVESCVRVENAAFPPNERATREKLQYRLRTCGELSMGIFSTQEETSDDAASTAASSNPVWSGAPNKKAALLGHVIATMGRNPVVTDSDMRIPKPDAGSTNPDGHQQDGGTICIHSFAILPEYQGRGLGKILLKAYLQRMETQKIADRAALIARPDLVSFYEKFGFEKIGKSKVEFGGGGWIDMVADFNDSYDDDDDDDDDEGEQ